MNPIKQRIIDFLTGKEDTPGDVFMGMIPLVQAELGPLGVQADADAIVTARRVDGKIYVLGLVGKSLLQGADLKKFLEAYFADSSGLDNHLKKIADYLHKDLQGRSSADMVLVTENRRFRSFKPLKNVDEVIQGAMNS